MTEYFRLNKQSLLILTSVLFILAIVLFFVLVYPLMTELKIKQSSIEEKDSEIELLQTKIDNIDEIGSVYDLETLEYEKKIPTKKDLDTYILSLQALELTNESKIDKIEFAYDSSMTLEEVEETAEETDSNETLDDSEEAAENDDETENESDTSEEQDETVENNSVILQEKPETLQVMTVKVYASSPSYKEFLSFIESVEELERTSIITDLRFTQMGEEEEFFEENTSKIIPFEAEITTFYYSG